jgi:hypothetical protein
MRRLDGGLARIATEHFAWATTYLYARPQRKRTSLLRVFVSGIYLKLGFAISEVVADETTHRARLGERRSCGFYIHLRDGRVTDICGYKALGGEVGRGNSPTNLDRAQMLMHAQSIRERRSYMPISNAGAEES